MIKAAFFDLDGTLLSHQTYQVSESTRAALNALQNNGIKTYLATGRHAVELEALPVDDLYFDGYITLNGQLCLDENKQTVFGIPFPDNTTRELISLFQKHDLPLVLVEESGLTINFVTETVRQAQAAINTAVPKVAPYDCQPIYQATMFATRDQDALIQSILPQNCRAVRWSDRGVDLITDNGGKVAGMRYFLKKEGILPEESIAFGDAGNDIDMLQFAGVGVAMGNAQEQVKQAADYVTTDIDENGVANALRFYGII